MSVAIASFPAPLILTDDIYDRERASDGFSRFGAYLAMRLPPVLDADPDVGCDRVRWASFAWATAAPPVMSPGYVEWSEPIEDIQVGWDDGHTVVEVVLRTECPGTLSGWRSWERDFRGALVEPWHGSRIALSRTTLRAVLHDLVLPEPPSRLEDSIEVVRAAKGAVRALGAAVELLLEPVLAVIDRRQLSSQQGSNR